MTDQQINDELAIRVLGWRLAPDRYITEGRGWIARWRFNPLGDLASAFQVLERAAERYTISCVKGEFKVDITVGARRGKASGDRLARTISMAVANAVGVEVRG